MANPKIVKGCLIATIVAGAMAGIISICGFISCGLASKQINTTIDKINAVIMDANMLTAKLTLEENIYKLNLSPNEIINNTISILNTNATPNNSDDAPVNFLDEPYPAYNTEPAPGTVVLSFDKKTNSYTIKAYGKNNEILKSETVPGK